MCNAGNSGNWGQRTILLTELGSNCKLREILVGVSSEVLPMARAPRITIPTYPHHIVQRGNNHQAIFFAEDDYQFFLECLRQAKQKCRCRIYAYVLMTNHYWVESRIKEAEWEKIRQATQRGRLIGKEVFQKEIEAMTGRRFIGESRGRPRKAESVTNEKVL